MEIKFTNRFPNWLRDLVEQFGLMQFSAAKYSGGVDLAGEQWFREHTWLDDEDGSAPRTGTHAHSIL